MNYNERKTEKTWNRDNSIFDLSDTSDDETTRPVFYDLEEVDLLTVPLLRSYSQREKNNKIVLYNNFFFDCLACDKLIYITDLEKHKKHHEQIRNKNNCCCVIF